jgi:hypothetical protein
MRCLKRLWNDEAGFIISAELVLVATVLVIGMIVGLVSLRNQVVQELVDVGQAIGSISQSFAYCGVHGKPGTAWTDGCGYRDKVDWCQSPQNIGQEPGGIHVHDVGFPDYDWNNNPIPAEPPGGEETK